MKKLLFVFLVLIMFVGCAPKNAMLNKAADESQKIEITRSGCCSWHGGVCGCDEFTGRIICCDGTLSPSCRCYDY